jgi:hypothetical protein
VTTPAIVDAPSKPTARVRALVPLTFTLLKPLHHGAGVSGNTSILRMQPGTNPHTGEDFVVPFLSGNSLRNRIRRAIAAVTLGAVDAQPFTLSKPMVDLLFSGGALTSADTPQIDLEAHRQLDAAWPPAGLLGYASRGQIWAGTLYAVMLELVCAENTWRMPYHPHLTSHPHAGRLAATFLGEGFGTKHDPVGTDADRWLDAELWLGLPDKEKSSQMIHDFGVIDPGAILYGAFTLEAATIAHAQALRVGWEWLTAHGTIRLGAKTAQGYGLCQAEADWSQLPDLDASWVEHLAQHQTEVMGLLAKAAGK